MIWISLLPVFVNFEFCLLPLSFLPGYVNLLWGCLLYLLGKWENGRWSSAHMAPSLAARGNGAGFLYVIITHKCERGKHTPNLIDLWWLETLHIYRKMVQKVLLFLQLRSLSREKITLKLVLNGLSEPRKETGWALNVWGGFWVRIASLGCRLYGLSVRAVQRQSTARLLISSLVAWIRGRGKAKV